MSIKRNESARLLRLTPILTPMPVNSGERPRTLRTSIGPFQGCSCTSLNGAERRAAGSTTAGRRCDSCPTSPESLEFMGGPPSSPAQCVCFDSYLTPIAYHQDHHRRSLKVASLLMHFLLQRRAPVAYAQSIVIWRYFLFSVDLCWGAGQYANQPGPR